MQNVLDAIEGKLEVQTRHESELDRDFLEVAFAHTGAFGPTELCPGY